MAARAPRDAAARARARARPAGIGKLLEHCGGAVEVLAADESTWADALGCARPRAGRCRTAAAAVDVASEERATASHGGRLLAIGEPEYPSLLRAIPDPPPLLWMRGSFDPIDDWSIAIVGSRRCSVYGLDQAARFARGLAERGHTIVSGGARGIDAEAHRAALRAGGRTIAVLGTGLARPYPPEHSSLFDEIVAAGGVVLSEQPATMGPRPELFPRRNRIVSGLALGVLIVEARARSGASITARLAVEAHGREAMAVPGRVDSPTSEGALRALREGWAALVTSPEDVIEQLASSSHLVRGANDLAHGRAAHTHRAVGRTAGEAAPSVDWQALPPPVARVARRIAAAGSLNVETAIDDDPVHEVLAAITTLEVLGLVRRDAEGVIHARTGLLSTAVSDACGRSTDRIGSPG